MHLKLNLKHKAEPKYTIGLQLYASDKSTLEAMADSMGLSTSMLVRSLINDLLDGNIKIDI